MVQPLSARNAVPTPLFVALRADGNGRAELQTLITAGFAREAASAAIGAIADQARLNITLDPRLAGLSTKVTIAPHARTAAAALIEVATASQLSVRISPRGQLIVADLEVVAPRQSAAATDAVVRDPVALPTVRSEASRVEQQRFESTQTIGAISIAGQALRSAPTFVEPDVLRSVQLLPGIEARSDWSAGFNVHGGESDQNLILLDGYPIYSPFHLGGLFSTFIGPTVGRVDLRKGSLPVRYGGRLSSVLDVSSAEPLDDGLHGTVEVSLASAIGSVGRTFADGNGSWMIAGRRTYADAVVNLYKRGAFPYHFQDVQGHLTRRFDNGTRFSLTAYDGLDVGGFQDGDSVGGGWGNSVIGATLSKPVVGPHAFGLALGDSATFEQRASLTGFSTRLDVFRALARADNSVNDARIGGSVALFSGSHTHTFGYELARQRISYETRAAYSTLGGILPLDSLQFRNTSISLFADETVAPESALIVEGGLRLDAVTPNGWSGLSPRFSAKYFLTPRLAITAGAGSYAQWLHSFGREEEPVQPFAYWVGSDATTPVSRAHDVTAGLEHWITPSRLLHVEAFYKRYQDLLMPKRGRSARLTGDEFDRTRERPMAWTFSCASWAAVHSPGGSGIRTRSTVASLRMDRTTPRRRTGVTISIASAVGGPDRTLFGARVNLASGLPTTPVIGGFARSSLRRDHAPLGSHDHDTHRKSIQGRATRLDFPWYERIDLSVNRSGHLFGAEVVAVSERRQRSQLSQSGGVHLFVHRVGQTGASFPNLPFIPTLGVSIAY